MHMWGECCEYKALETGPQILDVIIEFHSICKFSPRFHSHHKHAQPWLFPGHFCMQWKICLFFPLSITVYSIQAEEMDACFLSFLFLRPRQSLTGIWGNKSCHITNWLYVCKMSSFLPVECLLSVEELQALHNDRMTESNQNRSPSFLAADRRLQTQQHVHLSIWCLVRRILWTPHSPLNTTAGMEEPHQRVSLAWREKWTVRFEASFVCN